ncbi:MAG TPA: MFS transporter [Ferrovibrio sp.]|uniref:MFS transporter n=1 Tax=Ferrovibrio sp. TaxID=1917215 RepID=UPI002ED0E00A
MAAREIESPYAWARLAASVALGTIGGVGMWSIVVAMPAVQAEFGVDRGEASLPYTATMIGFMCGTVVIGRLSDRFGLMLPAMGAVVLLAAGYFATAFAPGIVSFALLYGALVGLGGAAMFAPLMADISHWFSARRGLAIGLAAAGNYFAGTLWPPVIEHFIAQAGWRATHIGIAIFCLVTMPLLLLVLRRRATIQPAPVSADAGQPAFGSRPLGWPPQLVQGLLVLAGLGCCVAMSMPQVHIVAYCVDLGYGPARGAQMLSLMLGFGIVSRLTSGWILDRIGGLPTLLLGSTLQAMALALYLPFDGLMSLYVISAIFGLVQGGIVPSYAFIVRELFPASQAGFRVSLTISATMAGMALGGWMSGAIYDLTGSYQAALLNGILWNIANMAIAFVLLRRQWRGRLAAAV